MIVVEVMVLIIKVIITNSGNSFWVRKQNICIYKDTIYIIMRNVKVMTIIKSIY
jgi:hypothetical protein